MFTQLITDNEEIILAMQDQEVSKIIQLLQSEKNPDYLNLLAALCVCEESAMHEHQERITRMLLQESSKGVVFITEFHKAQDDVLVSVSGKCDDWQSLRRYASLYPSNAST
jgi:hypothetical protein